MGFRVDRRLRHLHDRCGVRGLHGLAVPLRRLPRPVKDDRRWHADHVAAVRQEAHHPRSRRTP